MLRRMIDRPDLPAASSASAARRRYGLGPRCGAILLALIALAAGCGGSSGPPPEELVADSAEATAAVKSFHVLVDIQNVSAGGSGLSLTFLDGDVVVPDRMKARVSGKFLGLPVSSELVVVDDQYFLKVPFTGSWRTIEVDTVPVAFFDPATGVLAVINDASDLTHEGSEDVGGVDCYRLTGTIRASALEPLLPEAEGDGVVPIELWIGKDDLLLRRMRLSGPVSPSEADDAVRTIELSAFDEPVTVTAPS
jgi:lipoprotein LprG